MARYSVILPSGSVILKNEETGETLTLSATNGPLRLGHLTLSMAWDPAGVVEAESSSPVDANDVGVGREEEGAQTPNTLFDDLHKDLQFRVPDVSFYDTVSPVMATGGMAAGPAQELEAALEAHAKQGARPPMRVLDAPMEALTNDDFERAMESLANTRNQLEGELLYCEEIEAEEDTLEAIREEIDRVDATLRAVIDRKEAFDRAVPPGFE